MLYMRKNVEKTGTTVEVYCDTCGALMLGGSCRMCGADVCFSCRIDTDYDSLENGSYSGDYPDHYCPACWNAGKQYIEQIKQIRIKYDNEIDKLFDAWQLHAKKGKKSFCPVPDEINNCN